MKKANLKILSASIAVAILFSVNAHAQIVYTDIPDVILNTNSSSYQLDLNNDGINDFTITFNTSNISCTRFTQGSINRFVRVTTLNQSKVARDNNAYPSAIAQGNLINNANYIFKDSVNQLLRSFHQNTIYSGQINCTPLFINYAGNWNVSSDKYLGLKIRKNGMNYFGWVRLSVNSSTVSVTIKDYAFDGTPGHSIHAGATSGARIELSDGNEIAPGNSISIFPNPLSGSTTISFSIEQSQNVSLKVFDLNGRLIETLAANVFEEGEHSIEWNVDKVNAGIYFLQIQTIEFSKTQKLVITK